MVSDGGGLLIFNSAVAWGTGPVFDATFARSRFNRIEFRDLGLPIGSAGPCAPTVANSTGQVGSLTAYGSAVIGGPGLSLEATLLPPNSFGLFLLSLGTGAQTPPGSQGLLCLDPQSIGRIGRPAGAFATGPLGQFHVALDTLNMPTNPPGPISPGTMYFQAWHRDLNPTITSNLTRAVAIQFF